MMTSNSLDFKRVYILANEILASTKCIETFPYSITRMAQEQADVQICSYRKAGEKYHIPIRAFGSESAHWEEYLGANIIFFNEQENLHKGVHFFVDDFRFERIYVGRWQISV